MGRRLGGHVEPALYEARAVVIDGGAAFEAGDPRLHGADTAGTTSGETVGAAADAIATAGTADAVAVFMIGIGVPLAARRN